MNLNKKIILNLVLVATLLPLSCGKNSHVDQREHTDEIHNELDTESAHAGEEHETGIDLVLAEKQIRNMNIMMEKVTRGPVTQLRRIYGEISLNEERVVHQYPKYPGIVRDVRVNIGDRVSTGDTLVMVYNTETLSLYPVISTLEGEVLEKHAVLGEFFDGSEPLLIVGDLSSVWVNLHAFEKDRPLLKKGARLKIRTINGKENVNTRINYIKPVMNPETRTYVVRGELKNTSGIWNPGRLVLAEISYSDPNEQSLLLPESCLQILEGLSVVFIREDANTFEAIPVKTGRRSSGLIEILAGLNHGDEVVSTGSFFLKSQLVTSALSGHAGHGH